MLSLPKKRFNKALVWVAQPVEDIGVISHPSGKRKQSRSHDSKK